MIGSKLARPLVTSVFLRPQVRAMHIQSIPMWVGSSNNYAYLVSDSTSRDAAIIDPANPPEVLPRLQSPEAGQVNLKAIVNTHHHWDHAGGNEKILDAYPEVAVVGGKDCAKVTRTPKDGETWTLGRDVSITALHTPCHTQDSICYFVEDRAQNQRAVFTGDTLFIGGCGKFFEGTADQMHRALNTVLASLPDDTRVYPGHEYTKSNVKFLLSVSQDDAVKRLQAFAADNQQTQGRFTIADEKRHNVFMRVDSEEMRHITNKQSPVEVMGKLREMKNSM